MANKIVTHYDRRLSNDELVVITNWTRLSEKEPENGQLCDWCLISHVYSQRGHGRWVPLSPVATGDVLGCSPGIPAGFSDESGIFVSDPALTYWRISDR